MSPDRIVAAAPLAPGPPGAPAYAALALLLLPALALAAPARLSRDVLPAFIHVTLDLDPARDDYSGTVTAEIEVTRPVDQIRLHARELKVTRAFLRGPGGDIEAPVGRLPPDQIEVVPSRTLEPGRYTLELTFTNQYSRRAASLYRVVTGGESYLFTQFEATEAREAFPCWDEPEFKIPWQFTVTVPAAHLAVSNTPVERESPLANGKKKVLFRRTKPLSSYFLAIAVGPFETVPIRGMSVPGRIVCAKGGSALAGEAARATPPLLAALEKYFGRPYPYEKLDLIAAPEFLYGAMENAGAIVFTERRLLLDPKGASASDRRAMRGIVAHELAHMWFGDLVTMRWWDDLWLNESFATWMAAKVMDQVFPEFRSGQAGLERSFLAMETDARLSTGAMRQPIASADNLSANANELTYNKGRSVLGMFEGYLGEARFRAGVLEYITKHEWGNATGNDLWSAISHASNEDINLAMASFLDQGGVPLVTAEPLDGGKVRLVQRRFLSSGATEQVPARWRIPVILAWPEGRAIKQQRVWLTEAEAVVTLPSGARPAWILPNGGARGYYLWNVPVGMLAAIAADRERLNPQERIGFVRNLVALQRAGRVPVEEYLPLLRPFRDDPEPEVIDAVLDALQAIREPLVTREIEALFAQQVRLLLHPAAERIGVEPRPRELPATAAARPKLLRALGDMGQDPEVRRWADAYTARALSGQAVDPSLTEAALPLSAQRGDKTLAARLRERFETATMATERAQYLTALGHFRDPVVLEEILDYVLSGPLRPQEVVQLPVTLAESPANREQIYGWMETHYDGILKHVPAHMVSRLMPPIVRGCAPERFARAKAFFADP
ncbi:MAG: M1 family aminopeptidase, partial [Candidatus Eisenbacteria bacterium]